MSWQTNAAMPQEAWHMKRGSKSKLKASAELLDFVQNLVLEHGAESVILSLASALRIRSRVEDTEPKDDRALQIRKAWSKAADEIENAINIIPGQAAKTITFSEIQRLSVANSANIPATVDFGGTRKRWVGIGWCSEGPSDGNETVRCVP